jgi:hypothetical protein
MESGGRTSAVFHCKESVLDGLRGGIWYSVGIWWMLLLRSVVDGRDEIILGVGVKGSLTAAKDRGGPGGVLGRWCDATMDGSVALVTICAGHGVMLQYVLCGRRSCG